MPDYQTMTATEAMRHAKDVSGMTAEEIANAAGLNATTVRRYLVIEDGYSPGLDKIPGLCRAMRNTVLLQWLQEKTDALGDDTDAPRAQSRADVLTAVARAAASMGDVQRCLADAERRGIDALCAREVRGLLGDVISACRRAQVMILHVAQGEERIILASLSKPPVKARPSVWTRLLARVFRQSRG